MTTDPTTNEPPTAFDGGESLRARRKAAGVTTATLAGIAGCSVSMIERVEQGYRPRRSAVVEHLYDVLDHLAESDAGNTDR